MSLESLLSRTDIWRGGGQAPPTAAVVPTGNSTLDEALGGGWPRGALTELLLPTHGIGELTLLLPTLAALSRAGHWQCWVAPPYLPYPPALTQAGIALDTFLLVRPSEPKEALWAQEQALRSRVCGAVLGWPLRADTRALRRLQLAAEAGGAAGFLLRPLEAAQTPSPAALRLRLEATPDGLTLHVLKRRGGRAAGAVTYPRHAVG
ncbi:translesion DNA synthesis-associated protein ImuA [Ectothiorhodospiraceae bacterium 2226]|nr:translesion DNA synthesis-associated protein ImuA [Ectothiorhodospiraceae bacterium 2226]